METVEKHIMYTLFWKDGKAEIVTGTSVANAMTQAGYSNGAVPALDFWSVGDKRDEYTWNSMTHDWNSVKPLK